jgi:hypothetical protein
MNATGVEFWLVSRFTKEVKGLKLFGTIKEDQGDPIYPDTYQGSIA